jgi:hypothetical protein
MTLFDGKWTDSKIVETGSGFSLGREMAFQAPWMALLIPGALLSLCILLCLNRINLIRSDGNLLSWLLGS